MDRYYTKLQKKPIFCYENNKFIIKNTHILKKNTTDIILHCIYFYLYILFVLTNNNTIYTNTLLLVPIIVYRKQILKHTTGYRQVSNKLFFMKLNALLVQYSF